MSWCGSACACVADVGVLPIWLIGQMGEHAGKLAFTISTLYMMVVGFALLWVIIFKVAGTTWAALSQLSRSKTSVSVIPMGRAA